MQRDVLARPVAVIRQAAIEALESRRMLSVTNDNGVILIEGDNTANDVRVELRAGDPTRYEVTLDGDVTRFRVNQVRKFTIITADGNDIVTISDASGDVTARQIINTGADTDTITVDGDCRVTVRGGTGDDTITIGTDQSAVVFGNNGNDTINGSDAGEFIDGGSGHDRIFGNEGHDDITGGSGDDRISGNDGNDRIDGETGDDTLRGYDGNDNLWGGDGNDLILGYNGNDILAGDNEDILTLEGQDEPDAVSGNDSLVGGSRNDILLAHTGNDTLEGNGGGDVFDARDGGDTLVDRQGGETIPVNAVFNDPVVSEDTITLRIVVEGDDVEIPLGAGDLPGGTDIAEAIDNDGTIRFRDRIPRTFRLSEFFQSWGVTFDRRHIGRFFAENQLEMRMSVNGDRVNDFGNHEINDGDDIVIRLA
jgi:Ca2+-binding RTX toxin-like protein